MAKQVDRLPVLDFIVDRVNVGIFVVDRNFRVILWNKFMETHSGRPAANIIGKNLFTSFPELNRQWLTRKLNNVFLLKNFAFTNWEQRPHLLRFRHNRPITGGVDYMRQSCTFLPIKDEAGEVQSVCITIFDVTDTSIYQGMLQSAMITLEDMNCRDGLTGIYNRRHLEQTLASEFKKATRYGSRLSLLMFDLDDFKRINDTHGHQTGDEVLKDVARRISRLIRQVDIFGRYGGEEFAIIMPGTAMQEAKILAERVRRGVADQPIKVDAVELTVTISIGISEVESDTSHPGALIQKADLALYAAKNSGRNQVHIADTAPQPV